MNSNEEKLLSKLKQIKNVCEQHIDCGHCAFGDGKYRCKAKNVTYQLCKRPADWDLDAVKEALES